MSDNIKLVECFYTPSQTFTIYDYTKIAYPVNSYICIREIVTPDIKPYFIKIQHEYKQIIDIHSFNNTLTTIEINNQNQYCVGFYESLQYLTKINSDLVNSEIQQTMKNSRNMLNTHQNCPNIRRQFQYSENNIFILLSKKGKELTQMQNQLIVLSTRTKRVVCKAFIPGTIINFFAKEDQFFTVLFDDTMIIQYQLEENDRPKQSWQNFLIMEKRKLKVDLRQKGFHCWIKEQLITISNNQKIAVNIQGKQLQSITDFKKVKKIYPIICGFLAINDNFLRIYKKQQLNYVLKAQFFLPQIGFTQNLALSHQEDLIAFYDQIKKSIQYSKKFQEQMQNSSPIIHSRSLKLNQISFKKEGKIQAYSSNQSMFALSNGSYLNIYSSITYECYLSAAIFSQDQVTPAFKRKSVKRLNTIAVNLDYLEQTTKPEQITTLSLHPYRNIVAICLKLKVRFYSILYNQIRHIKDINLPNCKEISFSPSGQFIYLSIGGKQGAKTYIYRTEDFQLVECISVGRKVDQFLWSKYDNIIYGIHDKGYFWWGVQSNFKNRNQSIQQFDFQVKGSFINHKDRLIVYGQHKIIQICDHRISCQAQIQQELIKVFCQNQQYIMVTSKGFIIKSQNLDIKTNKTNTYNLNFPKHQKLQQTQQFSLQIHSVRKNSLICINQNDNVDILEWGKSDLQKGEVVSIQRKNIIKLYKQYLDYQQKIIKIQQNVKQTIDIMKVQLQNRQRAKEQQFRAELQDNLQRYQYVRKEKSRLQNTMEQNIQAYQRQTFSQVKQLQKMYQRKIALTTNKLLTSQQINYRNKMLAEQSLKVLQKRTGGDVQKIRQEYTKQLRKYMEEKDSMNDEIYKLKKQYESRLYDLQQQNQSLLKIYQDKSDQHINILKRNVVGWQIKYSQILSKKDNIQKTLSEELVSIQILKQKLIYLESRKKQSDRKCQFLQIQVAKIQRVLQQKNNSISCYQERINDLQKSNEILKYRVVQLKSQSEPQQSQIQKLKQSMNELQEQYDKIVKSSHEKEQMFIILKKQNQKHRQNIQRFDIRVKKVQKSYYQLYDKIMDITKSPIQQIRKELIDLLNQTKGDSKNKSFSAVSGTENPLGELNRIREHLQLCLNEAVDSNKRGQQQKKVQLIKKNRQNSQLIKQINELRRKVKILQAQLRQRQLEITRLKRGDPIVLRASSNQKDRQSQERDNIYSQSAKKTNPTNTQTKLKTQARQTKDSFFQKSLFKSSSYWRQKRLKTQQGNRRKKSSYQMQRIDRNPSGKRLHIEGGQQIQEYKRLLEQKQTIIKQLINKIQSLS